MANSGGDDVQTRPFEILLTKSLPKARQLIQRTISSDSSVPTASSSLTNHLRRQELTEVTTTSSSQRPLTPSCLTSLNSDLEPLEYITSLEQSPRTESCCSYCNAVDCKHRDENSKSRDTLGDIRSEAFDCSTFDSFDADYCCRVSQNSQLEDSQAEDNFSFRDHASLTNGAEDGFTFRLKLDTSDRFEMGEVLKQNKNRLRSTENGISLETDSASVGGIIDEAQDLLEEVYDVTLEAGRLVTEEFKEGLELLATPEQSAEFGAGDVLAALLTVLTFNLDLVSDLLLSRHLAQGDLTDRRWALATLIMAVCPLIIVNAFSLYWYWFDSKHNTGRCGLRRNCDHALSANNADTKLRIRLIWVLRLLLHVLLQATTLRQLELLYYGILSKRADVCLKGKLSTCADDTCTSNARRSQVKIESCDLYELSIERDSTCRRQYHHSHVQEHPSSYVKEHHYEEQLQQPLSESSTMQDIDRFHALLDYDSAALRNITNKQVVKVDSRSDKTSVGQDASVAGELQSQNGHLREKNCTDSNRSYYTLPSDDRQLLDLPTFRSANSATSQSLVKKELIRKHTAPAFMGFPREDGAVPLDQRHIGEKPSSPSGKESSKFTNSDLNSAAEMCRNRWLHAENDAAALDLIDCVLQDVPQVILQLTLLAHALPVLATSLRMHHDFIDSLVFNPEAIFNFSFLKKFFSTDDVFEARSDEGSETLGYVVYSPDYKLDLVDDFPFITKISSSEFDNSSEYFRELISTTLSTIAINTSVETVSTNFTLVAKLLRQIFKTEKIETTSQATTIISKSLHRIFPSFSATQTDSSVLSPRNWTRRAAEMLPNFTIAVTNRTMSLESSEISDLQVPEELLPDTAHHLLLWQGICVCVSLCAVSWSATSWVRAVRLSSPKVPNLSPVALLLLTMVHLTAILPQILCFSIMAAVSPELLVSALVLCWLLNTAIVLTVLCHAKRRNGGVLVWFPHDLTTGFLKRADDICLSAALGLVFLFTFVDLEGAAIFRPMAGHALFRVTLQTLVVTAWSASTSGSFWLVYGPAVVVTASWAGHIVCMSGYYMLLHLASKAFIKHESGIGNAWARPTGNEVLKASLNDDDRNATEKRSSNVTSSPRIR